MPSKWKMTFSESESGGREWVEKKEEDDGGGGGKEVVALNFLSMLREFACCAGKRKRWRKGERGSRLHCRLMLLLEKFPFVVELRLKAPCFFDFPKFMKAAPPHKFSYEALHD